MNDIIEKICGDILFQMKRNNLKVNELLPMKWISLTYRLQLNPNEQQYLKDAVDYLINEGYVTYEQRVLDGLVLTQKGFNFIYRN